MNVEFISAQEIEEIVKEFGGDITIGRKGENEFGEPSTENQVVTVRGYFYEKRPNVQLNVSTAGEVAKRQTEYRLLTAQNEDTRKINVGDEFVYNGDRYKIVDLGKFETSYFEMEVVR